MDNPVQINPIQLPKKHIKKWELVLAVAGIAAIIGVLVFFGVSYQRFLPKGEYGEIYTLVQDKVSRSAAIIVHLPKGVIVNTAEAKTTILFDPEIEGVWSAGKSDQELLFQPKNVLEVGKYYSVTLAVNDTKLQKDFLADEDPKVVAIFPNNDSEAPENTEITIVFNRPMVPLTTLDTLNTEHIAVEIMPQTAGTFKWISTRNLQFIPVSRLWRSAHYTVKVKSGFVSMDGLSVPEFTYSFMTRPLRYEGEMHHQGITLYDEPVRIRFNQPVDIEKTKNQIRVTKAGTQAQIPFRAEYGKRQIYDTQTKKTQLFVDKSILEIYNEQDSHGREKFWDFQNKYEVAIARAYPAEGDIELGETRNTTIQIPEIIAGINAESSRSRFAAPDLFDSEGKLWVSFYEDIDKDRLVVEGKNIREIGYGEKCKRDKEGLEIRAGDGCEKIPDQRKIFIAFTPEGIGRGENINIIFKKIFNQKGLLLNPEPLSRAITTYPVLQITRTTPSQGAQNGKLTEMRICTNTPLKPAEEDTFYSQVKSNLTIGKWNWSEPYRESATNPQRVCTPGEFVNTIQYGLLPESDYHLELHVKDDFGQGVDYALSFRSEKIASIYRNFFSMQKGYIVTSPEREKLVFAVENLEYLNVHICKITPQNMLRYGDEPIKDLTAPSEIACMKTIEARLELPKKFWTRNYFEFQLGDYIGSDLGHFIVTFSHPEYVREEYQWINGARVSVSHGSQLFERTLVSVTNLAVQEKKIEWHGQDYQSADSRTITASALAESGQGLYWVTRFGTLAPVAGATIDLYRHVQSNYANQKSYRRLSLPYEIIPEATTFTGSDGVSRPQAFRDVSAAIVTSGGDSAIVSEATDRLQWASYASSPQRTYIYTDRPIYRPGQKVFIKGITRIGYDGKYEILKGKKIRLKVSNNKGDTVLDTEVEISDYGTLSAHLTLDAHAPLGNYAISAGEGYGSFEVEEYAGAAFQLTAKSDKDEYIAGDTLKLDANARYYFGVPLEGGEVEYSIVSQDYYFDRYDDGEFRFGQGWYYSYGNGYGDRFIARGNVPLENGTAHIEQALDFEKLFKDEARERSKIFIMRFTAKNTAGQAISAEKSVIVHRGELYAGIYLSKSFLGKGESFTARIKTVDTKGKPVSHGGITLRINKIKWESFKRREVDGGYYYHSEKKKEVTREVKVSTDGQGNGSYDFVAGDGGEYEIEAATKDQKGNPVSALTDFYVYGKGTVDVRPTNNETLDLATDKQDVSVGEKIKIIIKSPYPAAKALVSLERGSIFHYDIVDITQNLTEYQFEVKDDYIPNVYASVLLLSPRPEIKYGQIDYRIGTKEREMDISVTPDKTHYLPGEKVELNIDTRDKFGHPLSAEVSVAVADMSVLALKGNPKKNPVLFFYGGSPLAVTTSSNIKNILYEAEIPAGTKGGGGGSAEDLARKKRGVFKDTAYWEGVAHTDVSGHAHLSFTLPDNLTTWQVETVGVTRDTKLGTGYREFEAKKNLMVVPLKPRFIIPGDEFSIGAHVFNQTDSKQTFDVSFSSDTILREDGVKNASLALAAGESRIIYFSVRAPANIENGSHTFILSAKNKDYEDTVEQTIPITRNDTYEATATSFSTNAATAREYLYLPENIVKDKGELSVRTSATLAVFLSDALNYLVQYPYGCSEQIASKLAAIGVVKRGLNLKNIGEKFTIGKVTFEGAEYSMDDVVEIGLSRIYANQMPDGGFTYYKGRGISSDFYLTLHVTEALADLRDAGYAVDSSKLEQAGRYLSTSLTQRSKDTVILTALALSRIPRLQIENNVVRALVLPITRDIKYVHEDSSNLALASLAILLTGPYAYELKEDVFKTLENRIRIDSRGAYLGINKDTALWDYYETPIKDTALLLKAWVKDKRESPIAANVLRWILKSRAKDGAWGSTANTLAVVDAFTDYLAWKPEQESEFDLALKRGDKELAKFEFNADTVLSTFEKVIPLSEFSFGNMETLSFVKTNRNGAINNFYYDMFLTYFLPVEKIPPRDEGFAISREFYALDDKKNEHPQTRARVGDVMRGHLTMTVPKARNFVSIEDVIPAGMELVNFNLATEDKTLQEKIPGMENSNEYYNDGGGSYYEDQGDSLYDQGRGALPPPPVAAAPPAIDSSHVAAAWASGLYHWFGNFVPSFRLGIIGGSGEDLPDDAYSKAISHRRLYPTGNESHDDRLFLFMQRMSPGVYEYDYFVRALIPGTFHHLPAVASEMYFPENFGRTRGEWFEIVGK